MDRDANANANTMTTVDAGAGNEATQVAGDGDCGAVGDDTTTDTTPMGDGDGDDSGGATPPAECSMPGPSIRYCQGNMVVLEDPCGQRTTLGTCPNDCKQGVCYSFVHLAGSMCLGGAPAPVSSNGSLDGQGQACAEGYCLAGDCVGAGCTPRAGTKCFDGDVYEVDSCGNQGLLVDRCAAGCTDGVCDGCGEANGCGPCDDPTIGKTCFAGAVREIRDDCDDPATYYVAAESTPCEFGCIAGECQLEGTCIPEAGAVCMGGDRYTVDSCGTVGAMIEACEDGCDEGLCVDCSALTTSCEEGMEIATDACGERSGEPKACEYGCDETLDRCRTPADFADSCECSGSFPDSCVLKDEGGAELGTCAGCWNGGACHDLGRCNAACVSLLQCALDGPEPQLEFDAPGGVEVVGTCTDCWEAEHPNCFSPELCEYTYCW